jgi:hypothetical protein
MKRIFSLAAAIVCLVVVAALAQSGTKLVLGMHVATLSGGYQTIDPKTKKMLHGYIEEKTTMAAILTSPTDIVDFHVCNTKKILPMARVQLQEGPPCHTGGPIWSAWKLIGDNLIAQGPGGPTGSIAIDLLPDNLQAMFKSSLPPDEVRAFSFPSPNGMTTLGIIKPNS